MICPSSGIICPSSGIICSSLGIICSFSGMKYSPSSFLLPPSSNISPSTFHLPHSTKSPTIPHSSSVSGLGISTDGLTRNCLPQNSATPRTYCTGSPFSRRSIIFSSSVWSSEDNSLTLPQRISVNDIPKRTSSTRRTMALASPASYSDDSLCQRASYVIVGAKIIFFLWSLGV